MRVTAILFLALFSAVSAGCGGWEARRAALDAPTGDVGGTWTGTTTGEEKPYPITLTLEQTGTDVTLWPRQRLFPRRSAELIAYNGSPHGRRDLRTAGQHDDQQRLRASLHAAALKVA